MRQWWFGVALGLGGCLLGAGSARAAPAVVSQIFANAHEGQLQLEIRGSEPLDYLLVEEPEPTRVSFLFLNATFGFPPGRRELPGPGLTGIRTAVLERDGSRLGRLDLVFEQGTAYRIVKEGSRILVRVDTPPLRGGLVLGGPERTVAAPRVPAAAPPRKPRPPGNRPLLKFRPEIQEDEVRVVVEGDGPLSYRSFAMRNPFRVVVDFEGAVIRPKEQTRKVSGSVLKQIRSSQFAVGVVRLVLDLARPTPYRIQPTPRGVLIRLGTERRP